MDSLFGEASEEALCDDDVLSGLRLNGTHVWYLRVIFGGNGERRVAINSTQINGKGLPSPYVMQLALGMFYGSNK